MEAGEAWLLSSLFKAENSKIRKTEAFIKCWSLQLKMFNPRKKQGVVACLGDPSTGEEEKVGP